MVTKNTFDFLYNIAKNNNKTWFDAHKDQYTTAKTEVETFVADVLKKLSAHDPVFGTMDARKCVMRIYRDVRFSKDKTPYKTNFGAGFTPNGGKMNGAGFYLHIESEKCFAGGGMWQPEGPALKAIRQEIDYNFDEFRGIVEAPAFKKLFAQVDGDKLVKAPKDYADDNPALEYLKLKSFTVSTNFADDVLMYADAAEKVAAAFLVMRPFVDFLNRATSH